MAAPEIVSLLRAIADVIERSDPDQVKAIADALSGEIKHARQSTRDRTKLNRTDLSDVTRRLVATESRQDAYHVLSQVKLTRNELAQLSRFQNVHLAKEDNIQAIEEKIVEALVGARLNSKAIRGDK